MCVFVGVRACVRVSVTACGVYVNVCARALACAYVRMAFLYVCERGVCPRLHAV